MTDIYHYKAVSFSEEKTFVTMASGPVIFNDKQEVLLHRAPSTGKLQFPGGRVHDNESFQETAVNTPKKDLGVDVVLASNEPFVVQDKIQRDGQEETLILIHYKATITNDPNEEGVWISLEEMKSLHEKGDLSTKNVILATEYFLS